MRFLMTIFSLALFSTTASAQGPGKSIIDVHLHAMTLDFVGGQPVPNPATGKMSAATPNQALITQTLARMQKHNIVLGIVSGPLGVVEKWKAAAPERLLASLLFSGGNTAWGGLFPGVPISRLRPLYENGTLQVLGEIAAQYEGIPMDDPILEPYFAMAEELDIPVGIHTGLTYPGAAYDCCPNFTIKAGHPEALEPVLKKHPRLRLYLMHAGEPFLQETISILQMYPQLYAELGVLDWWLSRDRFYPYLKGLMRAGMNIDKRIMFGTDQMVWPESISTAIETIESADFLTAEQKRNIFYNNAARFLRLSPEEIARHHGQR